MTWKIKGKIGLHFPNSSGNPNQDTYKIVYSSNGIQSNLQEIKKVYFLTPADASYISSLSTTEAKLAELISGKYDVWEKYWEEPINKILVAGTQNVAIEYDMTDATEDLVINSIEIFTDNSSTFSAKIKILHESGLFIAAIDGDTIGSITEKYELTGRTRSVNGLNITLYKGHKYYFVYQGNTNEAFYPAYFQGDTNGNYKVYANTTAATQITITDISTLGTYKGIINDFADVVELNENEYFLWTGDNSIIENQKIYVRSNKGSGTKYKGILGNSSSYSNIEKTDILAWLAFDINDSYQWDIGGYHNLSYNYFYYKTSKPTLQQIDLITGLNNDTEKLVALFRGIKNNNGIVIDGPSYWYGLNESLCGIIFNLKTGYNVRLDDDTKYTETTLPSDAATGDIFLVANGSWGLWNNNGTVAVYNKDNSTMTAISDLTKYTSQTYIDTYMSEIGSVNDLIKQKITTNDYTFVSTQLETPGKHFYLKLNNNIEF